MRQMIFILLVFASLHGCSNAPEPAIQYYIFPVSAKMEHEQTLNLNRAKVSVALAPYLQQEHLVVSSENNKVVFAHYHRWAQPLDYMIEQYLRSQLNRLNKPVRLSVTVERFHGGIDGTVYLQGYFVLGEQSHHTFSFTVKQPEPGYSAMVDSMTKGLLILSEKIFQTM